MLPRGAHLALQSCPVPNPAHTRRVHQEHTSSYFQRSSMFPIGPLVTGPIHDGPHWKKNDYTNAALHYYSTSNAVTNEKGELAITTEAVDTDIIGEDELDPKKKNSENEAF